MVEPLPSSHKPLSLNPVLKNKQINKQTNKKPASKRLAHIQVEVHVLHLSRVSVGPERI
jgi:hypothetical protein